MFERYTEKARRVIFFARYEASTLGSPEIGVEHLLLGLAEEDPGMVEKLVAPGVTVETFRRPILANAAAAPAIPIHVDLPLTNESKRVLAYAAEEAERLGDRHIRTGHLLLGIMREKDCWAAQLLEENGASLPQMRTRLAAEPQTQEPGEASGRVEFRYAGMPQPPQGPEWVKANAKATSGFERYTEKARRVIFFARYEASHFGAATIEPEHLLLGMAREAARRMDGLIGAPVGWAELADRLKQRLGAASPAIATSVDMPLSETSKGVLKSAEEECDALGGGQIGIGHLLLGLLRDDQSFPALLLRERGADAKAIRLKLSEPRT